jgi:hypothetical protein
MLNPASIVIRSRRVEESFVQEEPRKLEDLVAGRFLPVVLWNWRYCGGDDLISRSKVRLETHCIMVQVEYLTRGPQQMSAAARARI